MAHVNVVNDQIQVVLPPAAAPGLVLPEPTQTPAQILATEAVFAQDTESEAVAGLLGMWSGTLMLHALTVDALADQDEKKKKDPGRKKDEPEDPKS
jgi:hypothetical protein